MIIILDKNGVIWWTGDRLAHSLVCVLVHRGYSVAWTDTIKHVRRWIDRPIDQKKGVEAVIVLGEPPEDTEATSNPFAPIPTIYPSEQEPITSVLAALGKSYGLEACEEVREMEATNAA